MENPGWVAMAGFLLLSPLASAGSESAPEVKDATGDAGPHKVPAPGYGWADIVGAWFEGETSDAITMKIKVADAAPPPSNTAIDLFFRVGAAYYLVGSGDFVGAPKGGYYCTSDAQRQPQRCQPANATFDRGLYTMPDVPRAFIGAASPGAVIEAPIAEAGYVVAAASDHLDDTEPGTAYTFATSSASPATPANGTNALPVPNGTITPSPAANESVPAPAPTAAPPKRTPGPDVALIGAGITAALVALRRKNRDW